jgi:hypothetical protein
LDIQFFIFWDRSCPGLAIFGSFLSWFGHLWLSATNFLLRKWILKDFLTGEAFHEESEDSNQKQMKQ